MWSVRDRRPGPDPDPDPDRDHMGTLDMDHQKSLLQDLNQRLWSYINQVRRLESSNQTLEQHIEAELQRKSPVELKHLDSHLKSASSLQTQIEARAWEVAVLKLQFLGAELSVFDLKSRCEQEGEERGRVEAGLQSVLRRGAELQQEVTRLNQEAGAKEAELQRIQLQHQQDVRGLQGHGAGLSVEVRNRTGDSALARQLQSLSWSPVTLPPLLDWSVTAPQVGAFVPEEDFERLELRSTAAALQRDLDQLRSENHGLEVEAVQHMELVEQRLQAFGSDASRLCEELQTVLDKSENQTLLTETINEVITELRAELQRYERLLEERETRVSSPSPVRRSSKAKTIPFKPTATIPVSHSAPRGHGRAVRANPTQTGATRAGQSVQRHNGFAANSSQDRRRENGFHSNTEERHRATNNKPSVTKSESRVLSPVATKKTNETPPKAQVGTSVSKPGRFDKAETPKTSAKLNGEVNKASIAKAETKTELRSATQAKSASLETDKTRKVTGDVGKPSISKTESKQVSSKEQQNAKTEANVAKIDRPDVKSAANKENEQAKVPKAGHSDKTQDAKSREKVVSDAKAGFSSTVKEANLNLKSVQVESPTQISKDVNKTAVLNTESKTVLVEAATQSHQVQTKAKDQAGVVIPVVGNTTKVVRQTLETETTTKVTGDVCKPSILKAESKVVSSKEQQSAKVEAKVGKTDRPDVELAGKKENKEAKLPQVGDFVKMQDTKVASEAKAGISSTVKETRTVQAESQRQINVGVNKTATLNTESKTVHVEAAKQSHQEQTNAKDEAGVVIPVVGNTTAVIRQTLETETTTKVTGDVGKPSILKAESKVVSSKQQQSTKAEAKVDRPAVELAAKKDIAQATVLKVGHFVKTPDAKDREKVGSEAKAGISSIVKETRTVQAESPRQINVDVNKTAVLNTESKTVHVEAAKQSHKEQTNAKDEAGVVIPVVGNTTVVIRQTLETEMTRKVTEDVGKPSILKAESKVVSSKEQQSTKVEAKVDRPDVELATKKGIAEATVLKVGDFVKTPDAKDREKVGSEAKAGISSTVKETRTVQAESPRQINADVNKTVVLNTESKTVHVEAAKQSHKEQTNDKDVAGVGSVEKIQVVGNTTAVIRQTLETETTKKVEGDVGKPSILKAESKVVSSKEQQSAKADAKVAKVDSPDVKLPSKEEKEQAKAPKVGDFVKTQEAKDHVKVVNEAKAVLSSTVKQTHTAQAESPRQVNLDAKKTTVLNTESKTVRVEAVKQSHNEQTKAKDEAGVGSVEKTQVVGNKTTVEAETTRKINGDIKKPSILTAESTEVSSKEQQDAKVKADIPQVESSDKMKEVRSSAPGETKSKIVRSEEKLDAKEAQNGKEVESVSKVSLSTEIQEVKGTEKVVNKSLEAKIETEFRVSNHEAKPVKPEVGHLDKVAEVTSKKEEVSLTNKVKEAQNVIDSVAKSADASKPESCLAVEVKNSQSEPKTGQQVTETVKTKVDTQMKIPEKKAANLDLMPQKNIPNVKQETATETSKEQISPSAVHQKDVKTEVQTGLESSTKENTVQTSPKHKENIVIVKIVEEMKDSVSKTSAEPQQDKIVWSSEFAVKKATESQERQADSGQDSRTKVHDLEAKNDSKPKGGDAKAGTGLVVVKVTEEVKESVSKTNFEAKTATANQLKEVEITRKSQEVKAEKGKQSPTKLTSSELEVNSKQKVVVDSKAADVDTNLIQNKPELLAETKRENFTTMDIKNLDSAPQKVIKEEAKVSQNLSKTMEDKPKISQNVRGENSEIGVSFPTEESVTSMSFGSSDLFSRLPGANLDFPQNVEFQPNLEEPEEFLGLDEDAFCPQDLEEFSEMENPMEAELDFDEDLTEANVRVRPVERYVLKESPPMGDGLADYEATDAIHQGFGSFEEAPVCTSVTGSLQIVGAQRVIAGKEKDAGFGGLYREKGSGKLAEGFRENEKSGKDGKSLDCAKSEDVLSRNFEEREGKRNVAQTEGGFGKSDVDRWINTSFEGDELSEPIDKESFSAEITLEDAPKPEKTTEIQGGESDSPMPEQVLASETSPSAAVPGPKSEGSLESPFSPPASEWRVYGRSSSGRMSTSPPQNVSPRNSAFIPQNVSPRNSAYMPQNSPKSPSYLGVSLTKTTPVFPASPQEPERALSPIQPLSPGRFGKAGSGEFLVYGNKRERLSRSQSQPYDFRALSPTARPTSPIPTSMSPTETGRFGKAGSGEWLVYGKRDRMSRSASESQADFSPQALSPVPTRGGGGEWLVYGQNQSPADLRSRALSPRSPTEAGRFGRAGSGEWLVYGQNRERMSQPHNDGAHVDFRAISPEEMVNSGLFFSDFGPDDAAGTELGQFNLSPRPLSPPPGPFGRFGKADSGEWHIYGNSSTAGRLSKSASDERLSLFRPREALSRRPQSPEERPEYKVYRSVSPTRVRSGGALSPTKTQTGGGVFDLRKRTLSPPTKTQAGGAGRLGDPGKKWLVYKNTKDGEKLRKRALSPPEVQKKLFFTRADGKKMSGKTLISSLGKLVKNAKGKDRSSKEGGRVISSSDGPIGSQDGGGKKDRISVCKMAAMSMSRERSQDKKDTAPPPSVQDWLSSSEPRPHHDPAKP